MKKVYEAISYGFYSLGVFVIGAGVVIFGLAAGDPNRTWTVPLWAWPAGILLLVILFGTPSLIRRRRSAYHQDLNGVLKEEGTSSIPLQVQTQAMKGNISMNDQQDPGDVFAQSYAQSQAAPRWNPDHPETCSCGATLKAGDDYCLSCGHKVPTDQYDKLLEIARSYATKYAFSGEEEQNDYSGIPPVPSGSLPAQGDTVEPAAQVSPPVMGAFLYAPQSSVVPPPPVPSVPQVAPDPAFVSAGTASVSGNGQNAGSAPQAATPLSRKQLRAARRKAQPRNWLVINLILAILALAIICVGEFAYFFVQLGNANQAIDQLQGGIADAQHAAYQQELILYGRNSAQRAIIDSQAGTVATQQGQLRAVNNELSALHICTLPVRFTPDKLIRGQAIYTLDASHPQTQQLYLVGGRWSYYDDAGLFASKQHPAQLANQIDVLQLTKGRDTIHIQLLAGPGFAHFGQLPISIEQLTVFAHQYGVLVLAQVPRGLPGCVYSLLYPHVTIGGSPFVITRAVATKSTGAPKKK